MPSHVYKYSHDDTKNVPTNSFHTFKVFFYFGCVLSKNILNFVVWHVCRANEGYHIRRAHVRCAYKGTDDQTSWTYTFTTTTTSTAAVTKKEYIPIGIKVCRIYLNPSWYGWKLFCIADTNVRLSEHLTIQNWRQFNSQQQLQK